MRSTSCMPHASVLLATCCAATLLMTAPAAAGGGGNAAVVPPSANFQGLSYAEWSVLHWQWTYSLPVDGHPLFDTADCDAGQTGKVWFLGGTYASTEIVPGVFEGVANRTCRIPSGTALMLPLVNVEASTIEGNGETAAELAELASFITDFIDVSSLFLEIDGKSVTDLEDYRFESPPFVFGPLPDNNILQYFEVDAPEGATSLSVSDGYWAIVKPLSVGTHTLHWGGVLDLTSIDGPLFSQDITYTITVLPRGRY